MKSRNFQPQRVDPYLPPIPRFRVDQIPPLEPIAMARGFTSALTTFQAGPKPMLKDLDEPSITRFFRAEYEYVMRLADNNEPAPPLRTFIDPMLYSVLDRLGQVYGYPLPDISLPDPLAHSTKPTSYAYHADGMSATPLPYQMCQQQLYDWDHSVRELLHAMTRIIGTRKKVTYAQAEEIIQKSVRWNIKHSTFLDSFNHFITDFDTCLTKHRLHDHFVSKSNIKLLIKLLIKQLYPPQFRQELEDSARARDKPFDDVNKFFNHLSTHITLYQGILRGRNEPYDTCGSASSSYHQRDKPSYKRDDSTRDKPSYKRDDSTRDKLAPNNPTYKSNPVAHNSTYKSNPAPYKREDPKSDYKHSARAAVVAKPPAHPPSRPTKPTTPKTPCKYCGGPHWHSSCHLASNGKEEPAPPRPKARMVCNEEDDNPPPSDGILIIMGINNPFVADTGASANFIDSNIASQLQSLPGVITTELSTPITIETASKNANGSHRVTHKLTTNATLVLPTKETRTVSNISLLIVPDLCDEILIGKPTL